MRIKLFIFCIVASLFAVPATAQPYTVTQLTNLTRTLLPFQLNRTIRATNYWSLFDAVLTSVPNYTDANVTPTQFSYLGGVTSSVQSQLDTKEVAGNKNQPSGYAGLDSSGNLLATVPNEIGSGTASLSGGIYTVASPSPTYTSSSVYPDHFTVNILALSTAAGGETLKWGSGPAKAIRGSNGNALASADIVANLTYVLTFNAGLDSWIALNSSSGITVDSTLYAAFSGPVGTIGVKTNGLPLNRLAQLPANTFIGNPTGSTANPTTITLGSSLSFVSGVLNTTATTDTALVTIFNDYLVTNANGVSVIICDTTTNNITVTLPQDTENRTITVFKKDNTANIVFVNNGGGDTWATGLGVSPIKLFLRGEYVRTRGIGGNQNMIMGSECFDLGTLVDVRNYTAMIKDEFDSVAGSNWNLIGAVTNLTYSLDPSHGFAYTMPTGTATNTPATISKRVGAFANNTTAPFIVRWNISFPTLSTSSEYYVAEYGVGTSAAGGDLLDTECAYFRYASEENSGKFRFRTAAGGAGTSAYVDDTVITPTANGWYRVTVFGNSLRLWLLINDTVIGPVTTGLPTLNPMTPIGKITKGVGTTSRSVTVDYFQCARVAIR